MMVINKCMIVDTITSPNLLLFTSHDSPLLILENMISYKVYIPLT